MTFGNAPELIIAFFALLEGLQEVVKASIVGSIIGNILLVMGAAMLVGGLPRDKQTFSRTAANAQSAMLLLALAALIFPALFQLIHGGGLPAVGEERVDFGSDLEKLSFGVAIILLVSYVAGLFFSLKTHRAVFNPFERGRRRGGAPLAGQAGGDLPGGVGGARGPDERDPGRLDQRGIRGHRAVRVLRRRVRGRDRRQRRRALGGGAGGRKDKMDLAVNIAIGSSAQIALFVAPLLVLLSFVVGPNPMALVFNGYELGGLLFAVLIANFVTQEGESNWFEGVQLLALYAVLGLVFYFA